MLSKSGIMIHSILSQFKSLTSILIKNGRDILTHIKLGAWALVALYLSLLSGVIVGLQYDYVTPFYSASSLDILIPYGYYFRSLHFYSSQFFFFFTCLHLIAVYTKTTSYKKLEWLKLIATLPIIILLLFTGYILRGDSTGASAGMIAQSIVHTIPVIGDVVDSLLLSLENSGLRKVYIQHVAGLDIILFVLLWTHLRYYRIKLIDHLPICGGILLFSVLFLAPMDPEKLGVIYISGPWFFLGLQELLRYLDPFVAGVLVPLILVATLFSIQPTQTHYRIYLRILFCFLIIYLGLSIIAWLR
ncbi:MAG: quinol-cytochrome oxidoreductase complex cytochrome b subunit [Desulforhopalus sp.]|jgi:quinol-cytochrome oxidoreductase complex cytochrome b subunit